MEDTLKCPACLSEIPLGATKCKFCRSDIYQTSARKNPIHPNLLHSSERTPQPVGGVWRFLGWLIVILIFGPIALGGLLLLVSFLTV